MNLLNAPKMIWSSQDGWPELAKRHPSVMATFFKVVLPLSLLPIAMILYAASWNRSVYAPDTALMDWVWIAAVFLVVEWGCVFAMGGLIQSVESRDHPLEYRDGFRLAAYAPIPIWLSALSLFVPSLAFNVAVALLGLLASGGLIYHGLDGWFEHNKSLTTLSRAYTIFSFGALIWALVVSILVVPLL
ncbi:MAG: DUF1282 family protein [Pseudogulbenkiania sp.]|nr:DUF1282 family protein [Pseudogulbenkiania sp.]